MNTIMWILAGAAIGWAAFTLLGLSENRGRFMSMTVGAIGGIIGGQLLAPLVSSPAVVAGDFSLPALFIAALVASACLLVGNLIENRFGV